MTSATALDMKPNFSCSEWPCMILLLDTSPASTPVYHTGEGGPIPRLRLFLIGRGNEQWIINFSTRDVRLGVYHAEVGNRGENPDEIYGITAATALQVYECSALSQDSFLPGFPQIGAGGPGKLPATLEASAWHPPLRENILGTIKHIRCSVRLPVACLHAPSTRCYKCIEGSLAHVTERRTTWPN